MSIAQAQHWLKTVINGQPLHRDDLGEENSSSGTLRGISPTTLQLAPQLQQELSQELQNAPSHEHGISTPSLGMGGSNAGGQQMPNLNNRDFKPPSGKR